MLKLPDSLQLEGHEPLHEVLYLGGPMSGYDNFNYAQFNNVAKVLRSMGFTVINPAETAGGDQSLPHSKYMEIDLNYIRTVDAVIFLPGWRQSRGAKIEAVVASAYDKPIFEFDGAMNVREIKGFNLKATELVEIP